jgi:galactokinase
MPEVAWRAPGRVNLIGEHTDYNGGLVLPFTIDRAVTVTASSRRDGLLELRSRQAASELIPLAGLEPGALSGWAAYPAGVAWALGGLSGASLVIDSDLPQGAGLASSAALECAVAGCLADLAGLTLSRREIADLAWRAENEFVGMPCGIMDQSAVMLCRAGHALLLDCRSGQSADIPFRLSSSRLIVIDTGVRRELASGEYAARRRECDEAARLLGVPSLRDTSDTGDLTGVLTRRVRHVVSENARVSAAVDLLSAGSPSEVPALLGALLTQSHQSLRDDYEVSWPEADLAVEAAIAEGALGARMMGGGFGGCVLALVGADLAAVVVAAVRSAYASAGLPGPNFLDAVPAPGAQRLWSR